MKLIPKGPRIKPQNCLLCPRHGYSTGFVGDNFSPNTKIVLVSYQPSSDDVNFQQNQISRFEDFVPESWIDYLGIVNLLRCKGVELEHKKDLIKIIKTCRVYDNSHANEEGKLAPNGLVNFNPNAFIITYDYRTAQKAAAFKVFLRKAFAWAIDMSDKGYKPMILSGKETAEFAYPELFSNQEYDRETSFRSWVGYWWLGEWPNHKNVKTFSLTESYLNL